MTRLEEKKKAVQVLMGEISEMNPLQIKALIEGRLVNARGVEADAHTLILGNLAYQPRAVTEISPSVLPTLRGPKRGLPVSLVTDGEGDEEILACGDLAWVEAWFGGMTDHQMYWLPAKVTFRGYWEQEEEG